MRPAHAQRQQRRTGQACADQQQAGEQAAVTAQQHAVVGQFEFDPAQQAVGFVGNQVTGQIAVLAEHRQQVTRRVIAAAAQHLRTVADRRLIEHGRAGMGQQGAVGREERNGANVRLFQGLGGNAFQQLGVLVAHGRGHQGRQLFGDHLATLHELGLQVGLLHPGEIAAQNQGHQAGRQQGQQ